MLLCLVAYRSFTVWRWRQHFLQLQRQGRPLTEETPGFRQFSILSLEVIVSVSKMVEAVDVGGVRGVIPIAAANFIVSMGFAAVFTACSLFVRQFLEIHCRIHPATRLYITVLDVGTAIMPVGYAAVIAAELLVPHLNLIYINLLIALNIVMILTFCIVFVVAVLRTALRLARPETTYYQATRRLYTVLLGLITMGTVVVLVDLMETIFFNPPNYGQTLAFLFVGRLLEWISVFALTLFFMKGEPASASDSRGAHGARIAVRQAPRSHNGHNSSANPPSGVVSPTPGTHSLATELHPSPANLPLAATLAVPMQ